MKKHAREVALGQIKVTLDEFGGSLGEFRGTLREIGEMLGFVVEHMATKEDMAELRAELKSDLFTLQTQTNGIESDIRDMKNSRIEVRVADLEEKVFGKAR